jgi:IclR family transcriptional regulator, pca regulon regulatory protein
MARTQPLSTERGHVNKDDSRATDREFMSTLAKGLKVLASFGEERPTLTLSEAAALVGLSRAAARRVLRTLTSLGYVVQHGRTFALAPRVLELGFGFLATQSWIDLVEPHMKALSQAVDESCSAAILQGTEIVYVARMPAPYRLLSTTLAVGTRLPAFHTSLGRVQLGFLEETELWNRLRSISLKPYTPSTIVHPGALVERIQSDHEQGFSIVDEELERALRSIAVAIVTRNGHNVGAINLSSNAARMTRNELRERVLPQLIAIRDRVKPLLV